MKDIILMFASLLDNDSAVEMLDKEIQSYKLDPSEENFKKIVASCFLISAMPVVKERGLEQAIQDVSDMQKAHIMFNYKDHNKS